MLRNRKSQIANRKSRSGFTLMEMLIAIGIILILISVAIPVVYKVRKAAQAANTRQMLSRLEAGIQQYHDEFKAYPGAFFSWQLSPMSASAPGITNATTPVTFLTPGDALTSTEALYLALCGGLQITPNTTPTPYEVSTFVINPTLVTNANGPLSLNPVTVKKYPAMITVTADETTYKVANPIVSTPSPGQWNPANGTFAGDTQVPEIVDKFSTPSPILYMRAKKGAQYFYSGRFIPSYNEAEDGLAQYAIAQVDNTYGGVFQYPEGTPLHVRWAPAANDYPAEPADTVVVPGPVTIGSVPGAFKYYGNASGTGPNVQPLQKDGYILISAGPDGKYGTSDDITNFRNQ